MTDTELLRYPIPRTDPLQPPPAYEQLRQEPPRQVDLPNGKRAWLVTRHADIRAVLSDPRMSSDFLQEAFPALNPVPPVAGAFSFFRMDAPDHGRLRRMVAPEFTPRRVRQFKPAIEEITDGLLDNLAAAGPGADLFDIFALPLPSAVIARMLGVPPEDHDVFQRTSKAIVSADSSIEEAMSAYGELTGWIDAVATRKDSEPGDDVITRLVEFEKAGELSRYELLAMAALVLFAGHETTANQIGLSVIYLLQHPEQLAEVKANPELLGPAIEELLRHASIKQHDLIRIAADDVEIAGVRIARGEGVICAMPAGNHDDAVYADPHQLDIHRGSQGHLAFGHGVHACLGASLARTELEVALSRLFARFPNLALAVPVEEIPFRHNMLIYGVQALPVSW